MLRFYKLCSLWFLSMSHGITVVLDLLCVKLVLSIGAMMSLIGFIESLISRLRIELFMLSLAIWFGQVKHRENSRVIDLSARGAKSTRSKKNAVRLFDTEVFRDGGILDSFIKCDFTSFYKKRVMLYGHCDSFAKGGEFTKENTALLVRLQEDVRLELGEYFAAEEEGLNLERLRTMSDEDVLMLFSGLVESDGTIDFEEGYIEVRLKYNNCGLVHGIYRRLVSYCAGKSLGDGKLLRRSEVKYGITSDYVDLGDKRQIAGELEALEESLENGMSKKKAAQLFPCGFFSQLTKVVSSDSNYLSGCCYVRIEGRSFVYIMRELGRRQFVGLTKKGLEELIKRGWVVGKIDEAVLNPNRVMGLAAGDGSFGKPKRAGKISLNEDLTLECTRGYRLTAEFFYTLSNKGRAREFLTALGEYLVKCGGSSYNLNASGGNLILKVKLTPELIEFFKKGLIGLKRRELDILLGLKALGGNRSSLEVYRDIENSRMTNPTSLEDGLVAKGFERLTKGWIWGLLRELYAGRIALATRACAFRGALLAVARTRYNEYRDTRALQGKMSRDRLDKIRRPAFAKWKEENPQFTSNARKWKPKSKLGGVGKKKV